MVPAGLLTKPSPMCLLGALIPQGKPERERGLLCLGHRSWEVAVGWVCSLQGGELWDPLAGPTLLSYKMNWNHKVHLVCGKEFKQSKTTHNEKYVYQLLPQKIKTLHYS